MSTHKSKVVEGIRFTIVVQPYRQLQTGGGDHVLVGGVCEMVDDEGRVSHRTELWERFLRHR